MTGAADFEKDLSSRKKTVGDACVCEVCICLMDISVQQLDSTAPAWFFSDRAKRPEATQSPCYCIFYNTDYGLIRS